MDIGTIGKGKGKHGKGRGKEKQGQQGHQDKNKDRDNNKDWIERWNCGKRGHYSKDCCSKKDQTNKRGSKGKNKKQERKGCLQSRHDETKANTEAEVEVCGFDMSYFNVDAVEVRESERTKIGVSTRVQERRHGPRAPQSGSGFLVMRILLSARSLENSSSLATDCTLKVTMIGEPISEFEVSKRLCANHCCPVEVYTTMCGVAVMYGDQRYLIHKGSNVAKRIIRAWIQKVMRDSQYHGCTVACQENYVYNIYMKPRRDDIDAMPLSFLRGVPTGSEHVRPESLENPENPKGFRRSEWFRSRKSTR